MRNRRHRRSGSGAGTGTGSYVPWQEPGCVLALLADKGLTTVDATVASPNDLSTASWQSANLSRTVDTITDTADSSPVLHVVSQLVARMVESKPATIVVEMKAGTTPYTIVSLGVDYGAVDLSTGACDALGTQATMSAVPLSDGWYRVTISGTCNGSALFYVCNATGIGGRIYQGAGTLSLKIRNVQVTQRNVSSWADVRSNGLALSQATAASQPTSENGAVRFTRAQSTSLGGAFAASGPVTWYSVFQHSAATSGAIFSGASGALEDAVFFPDDRIGVCSNGGASQIGYPSLTTGKYVGCFVFNGSSSAAYLNSLSSTFTGSLTSTPMTGITVGYMASAYFLEGSVWALIGFLGTHDAATRARVMSWLSRKYGIALL